MALVRSSSSSGDVDVGDAEDAVGVREARTDGNELALASDQRTAVVDGATGFVAEQIGVDVAGVIVARSFQNDIATNFLLGKSKMAGAGIEDDIGTTGGEVGSGPVVDPGIAADFHADSHSIGVEEQIAGRIGFLIDG